MPKTGCCTRTFGLGFTYKMTHQYFIDTGYRHGQLRPRYETRFVVLWPDVKDGRDGRFGGLDMVQDPAESYAGGWHPLNSLASTNLVLPKPLMNSPPPPRVVGGHVAPAFPGPGTISGGSTATGGPSLKGGLVSLLMGNPLPLIKRFTGGGSAPAPTAPAPTVAHPTTGAAAMPVAAGVFPAPVVPALPVGWAQFHAPNGDAYYVNEVTGEKSWDRPIVTL
jgi:hypothetical protein